MQRDTKITHRELQVSTSDLACTGTSYSQAPVYMTWHDMISHCDVTGLARLSWVSNTCQPWGVRDWDRTGTGNEKLIASSFTVSRRDPWTCEDSSRVEITELNAHFRTFLASLPASSSFPSHCQPGYTPTEGHKWRSKGSNEMHLARFVGSR